MRRLIFIAAITCWTMTGCSQNETRPDTLKKEKTAGMLYQCGTNAPEPGGYVNDYIHVLTSEQFAVLDSLISAHEKSTSNQIAILTVDSAMLGNCDVKDYGQAIGNVWGVGQKDKNNGVVIVLAPFLHKVSISNAYGIEEKLSDEATKKIIDEVMIPEFKNKGYFEGLRKGLLSIMEKIK